MKIKKLLNKSVAVFLVLLFFGSFVVVDNAKAAEIRITLNRDTFESTMSQLLLSGDAEYSANEVYLSGVTHDTGPQSGALFFSDKVDLGANNSFSTFFVFSLENRTIQPGSWVDNNFTGFDREQATGADGVAFIVASSKNQVGNVGADLGYGGIGNSVCVEFDTYCNTDHSDPTYEDNPEGAFNHIALHVNGDMLQHYPSNNSIIAMGADYFDNENPFYVWIDYDGTTLEVYIDKTSARPASPALTQAIDLRDFTSSDQVYVGFSAAHGQGTQQHVLSQWNFDNIYHNGGLSSIPGTYIQAPAGVEASLSGDDVNIQLKNSDGSNNTAAGVVVEFFDSNNVKINSNEIRTDANGQATGDTAGIYGDIKVVIEGGAYDTVNKALLTEYNITYHLDGGTNSGGNPSTYNKTSETIRFADPAKSGCNFGGWFTDAGCTSGNEITEIVSGSTGDVEVWAKWTAMGDTAYKVEHYQQDITGEGYTLAETENLTGTTDAEVSAAAKNYPGFTENTAYADRAASGNIAADGSLVLKLYYDRDTYTVTYRDWDGTEKKTEQVRYSGAATAPADPSREGYTFTGWYKAESLTEAFDFNTPIVEDITLYAKWSKKNNNSGSSGAGSSSGESRINEQQEDTIVIVNGEEAKAGEENVKEAAGEKIVEVRVKSEPINNKIEEIINNQNQEMNEEKGENIVEIPITAQDAKQVSTKLTGEIVKKMDENEFKLSIKTNDISYVIPAKEIRIESIAQKLGIKADKLKEIEVEVKIDKADDALAKQIEERAKAKDYEIVFPPVNFAIAAKTKTNTNEEKEIKVSEFKQYVPREMKLPAGADPSKITTGIVYNSDGSFSHIPTTVFEKEGSWYAKLNSLLNSSYAVIWNPIEVKAVANHWSKEAVNDMASRLVIKNPEEFNPEENITRGEFAEYITKALGIYRTGAAQGEKFTDISVTNELADAIQIATEYGIIKGYPDGSFKPDNQINREEAMVMYAKAMDIAGFKEADNNRIENYTDKQAVADWAYDCVKKTIGAGVFNGRTIDTIAPKGTFTYAEAATAIRNLLIESGLINK